MTDESGSAATPIALPRGNVNVQTMLIDERKAQTSGGASWMLS
jgi:hypothetical protein